MSQACMTPRAKRDNRVCTLPFEKQCVRLANRFAKRVVVAANTGDNRMEEQCRRARMQHRRWRLALQRGWMRTANTLFLAYCETLFDIQDRVNARRGAIVLQRAQAPLPISTMVRDMLALRGEFDEVDINLERPSISVVTPDITLRDADDNSVFLGPFRIVLYCTNILHYDIEAIEPHPAATNNAVTHPHVIDCTLCTGDGGTAIRNALQQGRFYDFFQVVSSILNTYNSDSPYVHLSTWFDERCADCGDSCDEMHTCITCGEGTCESCQRHCHDCEETLCGSCGRDCDGCGELHCAGCLHACHNCHDKCCNNCLETCKDCGNKFCPDCRGQCDNCKEYYCSGCLCDDLCPSCYKEREDEENAA